MPKIQTFISFIGFQFQRLMHIRSMSSGSFCRSGSGFFVQISGSCELGREVVFGRNVVLDVRGKLEIRNHCYLNDHVRLICHESISIGDNVLFGAYVSLYDHDHAYQMNKGVLEFSGYNTSPVQIGSNVWIGEKVTVLKGVHIGDNVIIGAGSVVTGNIPSNVMAAGNPCKIIKNLE